MRAAAERIRAAAARACARLHPRLLALFGLWSWEQIPVVPPELMLLPPWIPLNIYDFACWARRRSSP